MEQALTSTSLTESQTKKLVSYIDGKYPGMVKYSPDLNQEVKFLVIDCNDLKKGWLKSKKFMYVVSYRPDVRIVDYEELIKKNTSILKILQIRPFQNLVISLSRLEDSLMHKIEIAIQENGGTVKHHLTNDTDVMISMIPEGKRYEACLEWGIHVVSPDWCYDSIDRGLPLNSYYYRLQNNVTNYMTKFNYENEEDTVGNELVVKTYQLGKRNQACDWEKLREWREKESDRILEEYIKTKIDYDNKFGSKDANQTLINETYEELNSKRKLIEIADKEDDEEEAVVVKIRKNTKPNKAWNKVFNGAQVKEKLVQKKTETKNKKKGPVLQGFKFELQGYDPHSEAKLKKVITKFGGIVLDEGNVDFVVVNFKSNIQGSKPKMITELAIERFIYNDVIDDYNHFWCTPFHIDTKLQVSEFRKSLCLYEESLKDKIKVAITSFEGTDLSHIERVFNEKLFHWIEFQPVFNEECDLLVVGPGVRESYSTHMTTKKKLAKKWEIPIMSLEKFNKKVLDLAAKI